MSTAIVRAALEEKIRAWAESKTPEVPVAYQNRPFTKPDSGLWVECFLIPNTNVARNVRAVQYRMLGIFEVHVWIKKGARNGMIDAEAMAEEIKNLFPIVPKGTVSIEQIPTIGRSISDSSGWVIVPILIPYRYEV